MGTQWLKKLCALTAALSTSACVSAMAADPADSPGAEKASLGNGKHFKIGLLVSFTGVVGDTGQEMTQGIKLYLDEMHNKLAGVPVDLIIENDESSRAVGVTKVHKLIDEDHVDVIGGLVLSNIALVAVPVAEQAKVPVLLPVTSAEDLTTRKRSKYLFRLSATARQYCGPFGEWVYKSLGYKKIAVISADYPLGYECVGSFQKSFEAAGGKIIQKIWMPIGFKDFTPYVKQISDSADAAFIAAPTGAAEVLNKQFKAIKPNLPMLGPGPTFDQIVLSRGGNELEGAIDAFIYAPGLDNPNNKKFVKVYQAKYHMLPGHFAEGTYVLGMVLDRALQSLHGNFQNKDDLLAAIKKVDLKDAPRGPMKFDEFNNPTQNAYVFKVQKVNGHNQNVPINTFKDISQFWQSNPTELLNAPSYSRDYPPCTNCVSK
jgi:branched-chain amino acid transport system substrate-binding protein